MAGCPRRPPYTRLRLTTPPLSGPPSWHFAKEIELTNDLGQQAFRMRTATYETVNEQQ